MVFLRRYFPILIIVWILIVYWKEVNTNMFIFTLPLNAASSWKIKTKINTMQLKGLNFPGSQNAQFCRLVIHRSRHLLKPVRRINYIKLQRCYVYGWLLHIAIEEKQQQIKRPSMKAQKYIYNASRNNTVHLEMWEMFLEKDAKTQICCCF